jgi:anti-sigma factor RsiW
MNKPPSWSSREESLLLLNAYLDNELDASSVLDIERRLATDAALKAEYDRLSQLRRALKSDAMAERASDDFRKRIAAIADPPKGVVVPLIRTSPIAQSWPQLAAAAVLAAILSAGATYGFLHQSPANNEVATIVADHRRALLAEAPFDIASSDRHTVKPWFDSKLALSPQVVDLASSAFPLAGGRVEIIDGKPVPVLVYKRRAHIISVVAIPQAGRKATTEPALDATRDGYFVIRWQGRDFEYFVVSDLAQNELDEFVAAWRAATPER